MINSEEKQGKIFVFGLSFKPLGRSVMVAGLCLFGMFKTWWVFLFVCF